MPLSLLLPLGKWVGGCAARLKRGSSLAAYSFGEKKLFSIESHWNLMFKSRTEQETETAEATSFGEITVSSAGRLEE